MNVNLPMHKYSALHRADVSIPEVSTRIRRNFIPADPGMLQCFMDESIAPRKIGENVRIIDVVERDLKVLEPA